MRLKKVVIFQMLKWRVIW